MARILLLTLLGLAGCQSVVGPVKRTFQPSMVDEPRLTIDEQEQRARDRLALPEGSNTIGPPTDASLPFGRGR